VLKLIIGMSTSVGLGLSRLVQLWFPLFRMFTRLSRVLYESDAPSITLLFSHPELWRDISNKGLPIISSAPFSQQTHDQIN